MLRTLLISQHSNSHMSSLLYVFLIDLVYRGDGVEAISAKDWLASQTLLCACNWCPGVLSAPICFDA